MISMIINDILCTDVHSSFGLGCLGCLEEKRVREDMEAEASAAPG